MNIKDITDLELHKLLDECEKHLDVSTDDFTHSIKGRLCIKWNDFCEDIPPSAMRDKFERLLVEHVYREHQFFNLVQL